MRLAASGRSFNVHLNTSTCSLQLLYEIGQKMSYIGILVSSETNNCEVVRETKKKVAFRVKLLATEMSAIFSQGMQQHKHGS